MRISDWSSDVCSSDLGERLARLIAPLPAERQRAVAVRQPDDALIFGIAVETLEHRVEVGARLDSIGAETVEVGEGEVSRDTAAAERASIEKLRMEPRRLELRRVTSSEGLRVGKRGSVR